MGINFSTNESTNIPTATESPSKKENIDVYSRMAKKVIENKDKLYVEQYKEISERKINYDPNAELCYSYLQKYGESIRTPIRNRSCIHGSKFELRKGKKTPNNTSYNITKEHTRNNSKRKIGNSKGKIRKYRIRLDETKEEDKEIQTLIKENDTIVLKQTNGVAKLFDQISLLPWNIFMTILSYGITDFRKYLQVNPSWYVSSLNAFDNYFNDVENKFVCKYSQYLLFKDSYTSSSKISISTRLEIRIDRILKCENLSETLGKAVTISYTYKYFNEPKNIYKAEFTFDSVKKAPRCVWVYKNDSVVFFV